MRRERLYLEDMHVAAQAVSEFLQSHSFETFRASRLLQSAVVHQLTVIGEAAARLSTGLRERHPEIPWADITGLRNIVVHNYFGIDWEEVWRTAIEDVPVLQGQVAAILREEFAQ